MKEKTINDLIEELESGAKIASITLHSSLKNIIKEKVGDLPKTVFFSDHVSKGQVIVIKKVGVKGAPINRSMLAGSCIGPWPRGWPFEMTS